MFSQSGRHIQAHTMKHIPVCREQYTCSTLHLPCTEPMKNNKATCNDLHSTLLISGGSGCKATHEQMCLGSGLHRSDSMPDHSR